MKKFNIRWKLVAYDIIILLVVNLVLLALYRGNESLSAAEVTAQTALSLVCVFSARVLGGVYRQIWRYGGIQCYIRLLFVDGAAFLVQVPISFLLPLISRINRLSFSRMLAIACVNLLGALAMRMIYRYAYKCNDTKTFRGRLLCWLLRVFAGVTPTTKKNDPSGKVRLAIVGAGSIGVSLAEELLANPSSSYVPSCFVDIDREKVGRAIHNIPVLSESEATGDILESYGVQEVVFAIANISDQKKKSLFEYYSGFGYSVKLYDFPVMHSAGAKRRLRDFDIEELLFRTPIALSDEKTSLYYRDKVVLIAGGGGSIGSELCRRLAKMEPRQVILLDIYENGAYDVQQEMRLSYGDRFDLKIEICSITNRAALARVFEKYHPQIVINAAAHKHVPLMENNCIEAIQNNVFGTANLIELCEKFGTERFMMVSTDKAVNPTNVMGATKRMCEMLVQCASVHGKVKYSATRFGNVLGSAGSVIPLFKKQIAAGGPVTITDKRIIRYFMTIPEASQLVLQSGAIAGNGELFVLDMGQPIRILDLAQNMIRFSGARDIEIVETGLRPGEKLYEELLVKTEELDKTENSLIFVERDEPLDRGEIEARMRLLEEACDASDEEGAKAALRRAVPTYRTPDTVNRDAENAKEMQDQKKIEPVSVS